MTGTSNELISDHEHGATMIESTFALTFVLLALFVIFNTLYLCYCSLAVQYVASRAMRQASLGTLAATDIKNEIVNGASSFGITVDPARIALCAANQYPCPASTLTLGSSKEVMLLTVSVPMNRLVLEAGKLVGLNSSQLTITATVLGRIEPQ